MVLGLMDFLLGGKRKTKVARNGQLAASSSSQNNGSPQGAQVPDGVQNPTQNSQDMQFEDQKTDSNSSTSTTQSQQATAGSQQATTQPQQSGSGVQVQRKSVSEALSKIHKELKETNSRVTDMVAGIKSVENTVNSLGHRIDELESTKKETTEKFSQIETNMSKFLSLYELINNQYNPFVTQEEGVKKIAISAQGNSLGDSESSPVPMNDAISALPSAIPELNTIKKISEDDLESSLLELDTLNIEEAAGNAVPLTKLKNNTNSLVVILSWLEYLTKRVGIEETRNTLRYYTEVLRWITPEVFFDLDKYLRGMRDKNHEEGETLGVRDHIVSLYFISKLNEKTLDNKLTKAVLQIIKN